MTDISQKKSAPHQQERRKRFLNILWFFDSNRTRTIRIESSRLRWYLSVLLICLLWLFIATGLLYSFLNKNVSLLDENKSLKRSILGYQIQHEQLYEKVYQEPSSAGLEVAPNTEDEESVVSVPPLVDIQEIKIETKMPSLLQVSFLVVNENIKERVSGVSWIEAIYRSRAGEEKKLIVPEGMGFDEQNLPTSRTERARFAIMRLKKFEYTIKAPEDFGGWERLSAVVLVDGGLEKIWKEQTLKP